MSLLVVVGGVGVRLLLSMASLLCAVVVCAAVCRYMSLLSAVVVDVACRWCGLLFWCFGCLLFVFGVSAVLCVYVMSVVVEVACCC